MNQHHENLKQTTHEAHIRLEKRIVTHIKSMSAPDEYLGLLYAYHAFIHPLEQAIARQVLPDHLPDIGQRMRAGKILDDIRTLGGDPTSSGETATIPDINDLPSAVGALYVLEGSTMGGPYIAAMIQKRMDAGNALTYFNGYGEDNRAMWVKFLNLLTSENITPYSERVIQAAQDTFETFDRWMAKYQYKQKVHESA